MRFALHTVVCCCVFTAVLPLVDGATGELDNSLKKRFRLQSRMKRELCDSMVTADEQQSDLHVGPHQDQDQDQNANLVSPPSSSGLQIRPRRSTSTGCVLVTCAYHDLLHRLHQLTNKQKEATAPERKIGKSGYGRRRRRRSLLDVARLAVQTGRQRRSTDAASNECLAAEIRDES